MSIRALLLAALLSVPLNRSDTVPIRGFTAASAGTEREWERKFAAVPQPDSLCEYLRYLSARPHHLGSARDSANAAWILDRFRAGADARIETFHVLFPTPRERVVELVAPEAFRRPPAGARRSRKTRPPRQQAEQLPTYNAYSPDGDVTAPLVFVNYGVPEDYAAARAARHLGQGRDRDRQVRPLVARHQAQGGGRARRGRLPHLLRPARRRLSRGRRLSRRPVPPAGRRAARQRAGHAALSPATRSRPASAPRRRQAARPRRGADAADDPGAAALLRPTRSRCSPRSAAGRRRRAGPAGCPITYHVGPGPARVHLKLRFDWRLVPAYDVIARSPARTGPDEWVVRGNHHDAWVNGAEDPISGAVGAARGGPRLRRAAQAGLAAAAHDRARAWDGEEQMLLGSTEWGETHADELRAKRGGLPQHRRQRPRPARRRAARPRSRGCVSRGGARRHRSRDRDVGVEALASRRGRRGARRRWPEGGARARRPAASTPWAPAPTTPSSITTSASRRSTSASAAKTTAGSTTRSTTASTGTPPSATPRSSTAGAGADRRARDHAPRERRRAALRVRPAVRPGGREPEGGAGPAYGRCGIRSRSRTASLTRAPSWR